MKQAISNPTDVLAMMNKLQERLFIMDQKLNTLINRSTPGGAKPPETQHRQHNQQNQYNHQKQIYSAVCADCQKECSIPFKPSGDRPVYCQECYALRRSGQAPKLQVQEKPRDVIKAEDPISPKAAVKVIKKKPVVKKAAASKKKTTAKKK